MRFRTLFVVLAAMNPLIAAAQNPPAMQCRTLESSGNFLGPDETIVNGMACKIAKASQQMLASSQPAPASATPRPGSSDADITNSRVIEMTKLGLDDDIIIAKIKNGKCQFQLGDAELVDLKKAGVSSKVVASMLDAGALTAPLVTVNKFEVSLHTLGQAKVGGRLGHDLTVGIKSVKEKAYLDGPHSTVSVSGTPTIEIDLPKGDTIDNYILVELDGKGDRRELEVESRGGIVGGKNGVRAEAIHKTSITPLGGNKFQMQTDSLKRGEYMIYIIGSPDRVKEIYGKGYDFTVR
jgi:hypothetical protein